MRHTFRFAHLASLAAACSLGLASLPARADMDSAIDKALGGLQIEKLVGQILGSIDFNALFSQVERAANDAAAGRTPDTASGASRQAPQAAQEMQGAMQKQMAQVAPQLMRGMAAAIGPMLSEMKGELQRELAGGLGSGNASGAPEAATTPNQ